MLLLLSQLGRNNSALTKVKFYCLIKHYNIKFIYTLLLKSTETKQKDFYKSI